jgi:hypothetical protein
MKENIGKVKTNIDFSQTTPVKCECGNEHFIEVISLRKVSKLLIGAPKDQLINLPGLMCTKCNKIMDMEKI